MAHVEKHFKFPDNMWQFTCCPLQHHSIIIWMWESFWMRSYPKVGEATGDQHLGHHDPQACQHLTSSSVVLSEITSTHHQCHSPWQSCRVKSHMQHSQSLQ